MKRFDDKIVVVTGAAQGIGAAVCQVLLDEGAQVYALDANEQVLGAMLDAAQSTRLEAIVLDITDPIQVDSVIERIAAQGRIDGLVNAAGVLYPGMLEETVVSDWKRTFDVNVHGTFHVSRAVATFMREQASGSIVTVASNAASTPRVNMGAYCASKAAAAMLTRCLGLELACHGIRCNVVSPGSTRTPMLRDLAGEGAATEQRLVAGDAAAFRLGIPLGKIAAAQDIASVIAFLLSSQAGHVTLQDLVVDGGATFG